MSTTTEVTEPDQTTTEPVEAAATDTTEPPTGATTDTTEPEEPAEGTNREAAKYRKQLRETETERDTLKATVEAFQRADIERLAAVKLSDAADVWRDGLTVTDVLAEDGTVDPDKAGAALDALLQAHPHWSLQASRRVPPSARDQKGTTTEPGSPNRWSGAFGPRHDED